MQRCTFSLCSLLTPYCCCFFKAFANTQTASGSESKRLSLPQLVLATKFDRSASYMARTPLTPRMEPSKPRSRNTPSNTATPIRICASRVTELLRHTHHKSYSCNGAAHGFKTLKQQSATTTQTVPTCASRVTELLHHTHHKSYSCNGANHKSETTAC